jgi:hypothetical protein
MTSKKGSERSPRLLLGDMEILPLISLRGQVVPGKWVLPGRRVVTTREAQLIARDNGLAISIQK